VSSIRTLGIAFLWLLAAILLYLGAMRLRSVDPFADYRNKFGSVFNNPYAISLNHVKVAAYDGQTPLCRFDVNTIDVRRDEREIWLRECSQGVLYDAGKPVANFEAKLVRWDANQRRAECIGVARLKTKDMEVATETATWEETTSLLTFPKPISGTLSGGKVEAAGGSVRLATREIALGRGSWTGLVNFQADKEKPKKRRFVYRWQSIKKTSKPPVATYVGAEAIDEDDTFFRADLIVHQEEPDIADCTGACAMRSPRMDITSKKTVIELKIKKATITDGVTMTMWPKPADVADMKLLPKEGDEWDEPLHSRKIGKAFPVRATSDVITYFYADDKRVANLDGHVHARQDLPGGAWREITANKAVLDDIKETLRLDGNVHYVASNEDDFTVEWMEISTKEGDESWSAGPGSGKSTTPKEKEGEKPKTGGG
jgi:hypothetical protein